MIKKIFFMATAVLCVCGLFACGPKAGKSDADYWFSSHKRVFTPYDDSANGGSGNLSTAGVVYEFKSKQSGDVTFSILADGLGLYQTAYFYKNGTQIQSESVTGVYSFVYKFNVSSGDTLKFHIFAANGLVPVTDEAKISLLCIGDSVIKEYDNTTAA